METVAQMLKLVCRHSSVEAAAADAHAAVFAGL